MIEIETVNVDIPQIIFDESKKYRLMYRNKNKFGLSPGDIVQITTAINDQVIIGVYVRNEEGTFNFHIINYLSNSSNSIVVCKLRADYYPINEKIKLCSRQQKKPYDSFEDLFIDKIKVVFEKNMNIIKCPMCYTYSFNFNSDKKYLRCAKCNSTVSFSSVIIKMQNKISNRSNQQNAIN